MIIKPLRILQTAAVTLLLASTTVVADTGVPLYVAENGTDQGDCTSRSAPCQSIGYALGVAGKNAQIRVAAGSYTIDDPSDLIYMVSGAVTVTGGHRAEGNFLPSAAQTSTLTGVPAEYRDLLQGRGFQIIADSKGVDIERDAAAQAMLQTYQNAQISSAAAPCANGQSGGFACNNIDLLSHVARSGISASPSSVADIWGFVDLNTNREYALVGVSVGTAVFDVTDPESPREVGFIDGQSANWRDIKVYQYFDSAANRWQAYAYVTTDGAGDGLFIIDLGGLPHSISRVSYGSDFTRAHNVYITNTDFGTGLSLTDATPQVIAAGSGVNSGQFRTYTLSNPASPTFVQRVSSAGYMHDAASLWITDQRTASCAAPGAPCEVLIDFNEERVGFWDVTNAASPTLLAEPGQYSNRGYVHSGWWSEDRQYVFVHDELDERNSSLPTTLRVYSLANLTNPTLVRTWTGNTAAIDHNGFVRGNRYYMSNYTRGLTVLDITDPTNPTETGYFDTFGANDSAVFSGAWGAYPFFHSGTVAVSDINSGLYLFEDQTRNVPQGSLAFTTASYDGIEGQQAVLNLSRQGGTSGPVSVDYEIVSATTDEADYQLLTGTVNWAAGDSGNQVIAIDIPDDGVAEGLEQAIVRLVSPSGGATLGSANVASLYISDAAAVPEMRFFADVISVAERGLGRAVVVLQRTGTADGMVSVDFAITGGDASVNTDFSGPSSGSVIWQDGDAAPKSLVYELVDDGLAEPDESFEVSLTNPVGGGIAGAQSVFVTIEDGTGTNAAPNAVVGNNQTVAEGAIVSLDGSQSNDPDGDALIYAWTQSGGTPGVSIANANAAIASFTAPSVTSDTMLQFQLVVTDPRNLTSTATTMVSVTNSGTTPPPAGGGNGGGGSGAPAPLLLLLLSLSVIRRISQTGCA